MDRLCLVVIVTSVFCLLMSELVQTKENHVIRDQVLKYLDSKYFGTKETSSTAFDVENHVIRDQVLKYLDSKYFGTKETSSTAFDVVHNDGRQNTYSVVLKVTFKVNGTYPPNPEPVTVTFSTDRGDKTAFSVLDAAKNNTCYNFTYKLGPEYGAFIKSMCDVYNDSNNNNYWVFYVNGMKQNVGVTCYVVKPNDVIEMQYKHF